MVDIHTHLQHTPLMATHLMLTLLRILLKAIPLLGTLLLLMDTLPVIMEDTDLVWEQCLLEVLLRLRLRMELITWRMVAIMDTNLSTMASSSTANSASMGYLVASTGCLEGNMGCLLGSLGSGSNYWFCSSSSDVWLKCQLTAGSCCSSTVSLHLPFLMSVTLSMIILTDRSKLIT